MLGAISGAADAVSNALAGPQLPTAGAPVPPVYYKGEDLGAADSSAAGSVAGGGDANALNSRAVVEFIHFGYVHPDIDQNFVHDTRDDSMREAQTTQRARAYQFRACLQREALLLSFFILGTQRIMKKGEDELGAIGQLAGMASDLLGSGTGAQAPKAADMNSMSQRINAALMPLNNPIIQYRNIHQVGIRLHETRGIYRSFLLALPNAPVNNPLTGMIGQLPVVGDKLPGVIGDTFNMIQSMLFKPFEIFQNMHVAIAEELEPSIEKAVRRYSVQALQSRYTPSFYLWYYFPPPTAPDGGGGFAEQALDWIRNNVDAFQEGEDFTNNYLIWRAPDTPPGQAVLMEAFMSAPPSTPLQPGQPPPAPKELADLALRGFVKGAGIPSMPKEISDIFREVFALNLQFVQDIYLFFLNRAATEPITWKELYSLARERILLQLVALLLEKIDFLRSAKEFTFSFGGASISPGNKLTEQGIKEINALAPAFIDAVLQFVVGDITRILSQVRLKCDVENALAMEAFLGNLPYVLSFSFKETFFAFWDFLIENTLGKTSGLGSVLRDMKTAVRDVKGALDEGRDYYAKAQAVKNVADTQGLDAGLGGTNLGNYQDAWENTNATTTPTVPDGGPVAFSFPLEGRLSTGSGQRITLAEYRAVQPNMKYAGASDAPA